MINLLDPLTLGRVQVQLPFIDALDLSPWARIAVPMAGLGHGHYFIPNLSDEVLVAFEHGDVNAPYIIGSLVERDGAAAAAIARAADPDHPHAGRQPDRVHRGATDGHHPVGPDAARGDPGAANAGGAADDHPLAGRHPDHLRPNIINMTPDGITITGTPNLNLTATAAINIVAPTVTINGAAAASVQSAGVCSITAPLVKIN